MSEQLELETSRVKEAAEAWARNSDPGTSQQAAGAVRGAEAARLEGIVLAALKTSGIMGMTTHELVSSTGLDYASTTPRLAPMRRKGLVIDSGQRRPSHPGSNRKCIVWRATA